jgi:hypothetical protein
MIRFLIGFGLLLIVGSTLAGEATLRLKFTRGDEMVYRVQQITSATESSLDDKTGKEISSKTLTRLTLQKKWVVSQVDANGEATLELRLEKMKLERETGKGEPDVFDSEKDDESSKGLKKLIGPVLAVVKVSDRGAVIEVKESNYGPASRFQAELPFRLLLPEKTPAEGGSWKRDYAIKLDPPAGTGESYESSQTYTLKPAVNGFQVIGIGTTVKQPPMQAEEMIPLLPYLAEGEIYFDAESGRYYAARFKTERTLNNHLGAGSKYVYVCTYAEDYVPKK